MPDLILSVRVTPRAARSEIIGVDDGVVRVRIASPPVDGAANTELIKLLAKRLGVPRSGLELVGGAASRSKRIRVDGIEHDRAIELLQGKI